MMDPLTPSLPPNDDDSAVINDETLRSLVAHALLESPLPHPTVIVQPDPMNNRWKKHVVNLPLWLVLTGDKTHHSHLSTNGITITINATRTMTRFDMGDGTHIDCTTTSSRPHNTNPWEPSPTCGYTYTQTGTYTITATTLWTITWSADTHHGTLATTTHTTYPITITQLTSRIIG